MKHETNLSNFCRPGRRKTTNTGCLRGNNKTGLSTCEQIWINHNLKKSSSHNKVRGWDWSTNEHHQEAPERVGRISFDPLCSCNQLSHIDLYYVLFILTEWSSFGLPPDLHWRGWSIKIDCSQTVRRVYWGLMGMNSQYLKIYVVQCSFPVPSVPERNVRVPWRDLIWWTSAPAWLSTGPPSEGHKTGSIENGQSEGHQRGICPVCCRMNKLLMPTHLQTWPRSHRKVWNKEEIYCSYVQWIFTAVCFVQTENWSYTRT